MRLPALSLLCLALLLLPGIGRGEDLQALAPQRSIVDMCGREVRVPAQVRHVVTAGGTPAVNALLFALGKANTIVNGLPLVMRSRWKWQTVFAPQLATAPPVSSMGPAWVPDLESLQMLPCDVVFVDSRTTAEMLAARGFTTVCLSWHDPEAILKSIALLGDVMDCPQQAADYRAYFEDVIQRVTDHLASLPADKRRSALYLRVSPLGVPMVATNRYLTQKAGGLYACSEDLPLDHPNISIEQLLQWDPDVILVWSAKEAQELLSDSRFQDLRAIKHRAVVIVPFGAHAWTHATPEQALGILWLAKRLYPERFSDIDMGHEAQLFYKRFFMKELSENQIMEILQGQPAPRP